MAAQSLRTVGVRNDEEARKGPATLAIGRHLGSKGRFKRLTETNVCYVAPKPLRRLPVLTTRLRPSSP